MSKVAIDLLIFIDGALQLPIHQSNLRSVPRITALFLLLNSFDAGPEVPI